MLFWYPKYVKSYSATEQLQNNNNNKKKETKILIGKKYHGFCETLEILSHFEAWQCSSSEVNFPRCFVLPI